jgi:hypothetical protein
LRHPDVSQELTELLPEPTFAQRSELSLARDVHAHPALSGALMEAADDVDAINIGSLIALTFADYAEASKRPRAWFLLESLEMAIRPY